MASSIIPKALNGDISSLNDALANVITNMGGVQIDVDSVASNGGTKTITASQLYVIIGSSTANHAIFQCRSGVVITHSSTGSSITCTASGTTYTLGNGSTSAARYIAFIVS